MLSSISSIIDSFGSAVDKNITSDEERLKCKAALETLRQTPSLAQVKLNEIQLKHPSKIIAGARPFNMYMIGIILAIALIPYYSLASYMWVVMSLKAHSLFPYPVSITPIKELFMAQMGLYGMRAVEKLKGVAS